MLRREFVRAVVVAGFAAQLAAKRKSENALKRELAARLALLVSEILFPIAEREHWSYLRTETTRLRLSVLPLLNHDRSIMSHRDRV